MRLAFDLCRKFDSLRTSAPKLQGRLPVGFVIDKGGIPHDRTNKPAARCMLLSFALRFPPTHFHCIDHHRVSVRTVSLSRLKPDSTDLNFKYKRIKVQLFRGANESGGSHKAGGNCTVNSFSSPSKVSTRNCNQNL